LLRLARDETEASGGGVFPQRFEVRSPGVGVAEGLLDLIESRSPSESARYTLVPMISERA
jgi:hypothetical protein